MKRLMILYINLEPVFLSRDKDSIWKEIGKTWNIYEVRYSDTNELVEEFVPF